MKIAKNKTLTTMITLFLILAIASSLAVLTLQAQVIQPVVDVPNWLYVSAAPNPVGVGQPVIIVIWDRHIPPSTWEDPSRGAPGGRECFTGITLTITKPDGTKDTVAMPPSDPVGSNWYSYVPEQAGTYSVQGHFPGQWRNATSSPPWGPSNYHPMPGSYYFGTVDSEIQNFTVTQELLSPVPGVPLPTEYWARPIHSYNRQWSTIAGNWITGLRDAPYITGPNTAHIMWTQPYFIGGIAGGASESLSYYEGTSYESKFGGVTIINGILFYNLNLGSSSTASHGSIVARDLRTGEQLWTVNGTFISSSTIYDYSSRNQHGLHPYLWVSGNRVLDPFSGTEVFRYINVPSGVEAVGPQGERLIYVIGGPSSNRAWLALWNFSKPLSMTGLSASEIATIQKTGIIAGTTYDQWRPIGKTHNGTEAYSWNVTLPPGLSDVMGYGTGSSPLQVLEDRVICGSGFGDGTRSSNAGNVRMWAVSTKEGQRGQLLWSVKITPPQANLSISFSSDSQEDGVIVLRATESRQFIGFDIDNGQQLWVTESQPPWMMYSAGSTINYGKLYSAGYGGQVFAYDIKTGALNWTANADSEGLESAYERSPLSITVVDGKVYARSQEHSFTNPLYRTWKTYCFDAETGASIWDLTGTGSGYGFSDGYMAYLQYSDLQIYCVGKGPSATSVAASPKVSMYGNSVLVEGMVTDISAGTEKSAISSRFPNGVPAISDESMSRWMEYVYMQMPRPTNATGVSVDIDVIDSNGNYRNIGTTVSDSNGFYSLNWTPDIEGKYTVIANFQGTESYWQSHAETSFVVNEAAPTSSPQPVVELPPTEMYFAISTAAIIFAIAIVGILLLRKRP